MPTRPPPTVPLVAADIRRAARDLGRRVIRTPVLAVPLVDDELGCRVLFKAEPLQHTGSYKARGALLTVDRLPPDARDRGIVVPSSGNHGAAMAWAAADADVPCTVVVPVHTPEHKLDALTRYGAAIVPTNRRDETAEALASTTGATLVHPGRHPDVLAGAGTVALELLAQAGPFDLIITPVGAGSLLASTAVVAAATSPSSRCLGAEPEVADDAHRSLRTGIHQPAVSGARSVAEGLLGRLGEHPLALMRHHGADVLTVTEEQIVAAARELTLLVKIVVEPSAAVGFALLRTLELPKGSTVGVILSGGNTDLRWLR